MSLAILYWGTPVVIISTTNEDGTTNIAPMSSAWWLHQRCMLGLAAESQTTINLQRTKQCVLNLPSDDMVAHVNALAKTTGRPDVSGFKQAAGYQFVKDKFGVANLTARQSETVEPHRIDECPVQMEAVLVAVNEMGRDQEDMRGKFLGLEVKIQRVHVEETLVERDNRDKVNADRWQPLMHSFQQFYGLSARLQPSRLAEIDEENYR